MRRAALLLVLMVALPGQACLNDSRIERNDAEFRAAYAALPSTPDPGTPTLWRSLGLVAFLICGTGGVVVALIRLQNSV